MSRDEPESKRRKIVERSGDALDDELDYEVDSDAAGDLASIHSDSSPSDAEDESAADESGQDGPNSSNPATNAASVQGVKSKTISPEEKRRRRKERKLSTKKRKLEELGDNDDDALDLSSPDLLNLDQQADLFARLIRDHAPKDLTSLELSDRYLSTTSFLDTVRFNGPRNLSTVSSFLAAMSEREDLKIAGKEVGRPHTLVLCQSAIRVADLVRSLKPQLKHKNGDLAKLFGKEKLSDQVSFLNKTRVNVAIGVPGRVLALIKDGALKVDRVEQVVVDHSYRDAKKRGMMQIKEVTKDLIDVLGRDILDGRLRDGKCKIVLF